MRLDVVSMWALGQSYYRHSNTLGQLWECRLCCDVGGITSLRALQCFNLKSLIWVQITQFGVCSTTILYFCGVVLLLQVCNPIWRNLVYIIIIIMWMAFTEFGFLASSLSSFVLINHVNNSCVIVTNRDWKWPCNVSPVSDQILKRCWIQNNGVQEVHWPSSHWRKHCPLPSVLTVQISVDQLAEKHDILWLDNWSEKDNTCTSQ